MSTVNRYAVYGMSVASDMPLTLPRDASTTPAHIHIHHDSPAFFRDVVSRVRFRADVPSWCQYGRLADGSTYLHWTDLGEFLVSGDGGSIRCRRFDDASTESFDVYLLQRALSFALVKLGVEPLHSTAVVIDGFAIGFFGRAGFGKSTLAAAFLQAGNQLLTDDLLVIGGGPSAVYAYPGPARIKLFPGTARRLLGPQIDGVPMNPDTKKLVMRLEPSRVSTQPVPLRAFYVLPLPRAIPAPDVRLELLGARRAVLEIVRHTFNSLHTDADRLERQFVEAARLAQKVPVKQLVHPRTMACLPDVREAIVADLQANLAQGDRSVFVGRESASSGGHQA